MSNRDVVDEFRRAYEAGERPDAKAFIEGAPPADQDAVAQGIREVLEQVPPPDPAPETLAMVQAMLQGEHPLMVLRQQKGMTRDAVVGRLTEDLGLEPTQETKVAGYYHELETGQLPLAGIRDRVFDALARALGVARTTLVLEGPGRGGGGAGGMAFARAAVPGAPVEIDAALLAAPPGEPDEVDDLFTGGPG